MADFGTPNIGDELAALAQEHPHLNQHLAEFYDEHGEYPLLIEEADDEYESDRPNVIYPVGEQVFIHIFGDRGISTYYTIVQPTLDEDESRQLEKIRDRLLKISANHPAPADESEFEDYLDDMLPRVVSVEGDSVGGILSQARSAVLGDQVTVSPRTYEKIRYRLQRDIAGLGPLEPVMQDTANEDIHVIGTDGCYVDHAVYSMLPTNVSFGTPQEFDNWLKNMGERIDNPVSDSDPIIDNTLPDGSRINIIYSDDVSVQGPSLTVRQGEEVPLSIFQITKWGTLSPKLAAYLWLCLENEQTVFVVGETASGKTTTLNAILSFIPRDSKIYTAEDTAEVIPPHNTWQQLLTRESPGEDESTDIDLFDLVAAALRSRPDYIIVGEVRGAEAQMAFQAAQTGHPVMLTFHASDIKSMLQRFTSEPINIPETFMDNADVALFQNRVKQGDDVLRRVTSVQEIEGYSKHAGGIITREVFSWDPAKDNIDFNGMNNSYVLEDQIAELLGYEDTSNIYNELERREEIIRQLIEADVLGYSEVNEAIETVQRDGVEALPMINSANLG